MSRRYTRIAPEMVPIMSRLQADYRLTYDEIADLFGCSRSRVIQLVQAYRKGGGDALAAATG